MVNDLKNALILSQSQPCCSYTQNSYETLKNVDGALPHIGEMIGCIHKKLEWMNTKSIFELS